MKELPVRSPEWFAEKMEIVETVYWLNPYGSVTRLCICDESHAKNLQRFQTTGGRFVLESEALRLFSAALLN